MSEEIYTLADGTVVTLTMADAAGPDSKLRLNKTAAFIKFDDGEWVPLGCHLHIARLAIKNAIAAGDASYDLLYGLRQYLRYVE